MHMPIVAIVGSPNVGKSTFVNRITRRRDAIVHESAGVTRDCSYYPANWNGMEFMLIDTGGVAVCSLDRFQESVSAQALAAANSADVIIFMLDGQLGVSNDDANCAKILQRAHIPVIPCVNKMDNPAASDGLWDFYALGFGEPWPISAIHGIGTGDLLDELVRILADKLVANAEQAGLKTDESMPVSSKEITLALIGRPNAGKSTLANRFIGKNRSLVSELAGTTRDAVDTVIETPDGDFRIIDTAGIRKKSRVSDELEYYGVLRSLRAIERAQIVLLILDASCGLTDIDQHLARLTQQGGRGLLIIFNKWDLVTDASERLALKEQLSARMNFVKYAPLFAVSAQSGKGVHKIIPAVTQAHTNYTTRIPTNKLNQFLEHLREVGHTNTSGSKRLKLHYMTQTGICPPSFTFFANLPELVNENYKRYLENRMRQTFDLTATPVRFKFKRKN